MGVHDVDACALAPLLRVAIGDDLEGSGLDPGRDDLGGLGFVEAEFMHEDGAGPALEGAAAAGGGVEGAGCGAIGEAVEHAVQLGRGMCGPEAGGFPGGDGGDGIAVGVVFGAVAEGDLFEAEPACAGPERGEVGLGVGEAGEAGAVGLGDAEALGLIARHGGEDAGAARGVGEGFCTAGGVHAGVGAAGSGFADVMDKEDGEVGALRHLGPCGHCGVHGAVIVLF